MHAWNKQTWKVGKNNKQQKHGEHMANTFYKVNSILEMTLPPSPKKIHEICLQMLSYVDKKCPGISLEFLHDVEGTSLVDLLAERVLEMNGTEQNIHRNHADTT